VFIYTAKELSLVMDMLYDIADSQIIGRNKNRTDGCTRSKKDVLANDLLYTLKKLDATGATLNIAVDPIGPNRTMTFTSNETISLSMCRRLVSMETILSHLKRLSVTML